VQGRSSNPLQGSLFARRDALGLGVAYRSLGDRFVEIRFAVAERDPRLALGCAAIGLTRSAAIDHDHIVAGPPDLDDVLGEHRAGTIQCDDVGGPIAFAGNQRHTAALDQASAIAGLLITRVATRSGSLISLASSMETIMSVATTLAGAARGSTPKATTRAQSAAHVGTRPTQNNTIAQFQLYDPIQQPPNEEADDAVHLRSK